MRIGHGFDAHKFSESDDLVLGGITINTAPKLEAHSDGDVLIHALCDAILGALALGDIGKHFPDSDIKYDNIDSRILLRHVADLMYAQNYVVGNCDITVIAQHPKLASYLPMMCEVLSDDLNISKQQINIKATTTEKMGYIGRGEGISVHSIVLLLNA